MDAQPIFLRAIGANLLCAKIKEEEDGWAASRFFKQVCPANLLAKSLHDYLSLPCLMVSL